MSNTFGCPPYDPSDPTRAVGALALLASMTLKEFFPAMEKLNRPDWWAMAMTKQRLEHPEDPAWFVDTPSTVRVLSLDP